MAGQTIALPDGCVGVLYNQPIVWDDLGNPDNSIIDNLDLPPGVVIVEDVPVVPYPIVSISPIGIPTAAGNYSFHITWYNQPGNIVIFEATYTITINNCKKKRRISAPETFCCKPEQFKGKVCPPELRSTSGFRYVNIGNGCYIKVRNR